MGSDRARLPAPLGPRVEPPRVPVRGPGRGKGRRTGSRGGDRPGLAKPVPQGAAEGAGQVQRVQEAPLRSGQTDTACRVTLVQSWGGFAFLRSGGTASPCDLSSFIVYKQGIGRGDPEEASPVQQRRNAWRGGEP